MKKTYTQSVRAMSATAVSVCTERVRPLAAQNASGNGTDVRHHVKPQGGAAAVRIAPMPGLMREKSVHILLAERVQTVLGNTQQLSGYGFGTPVGVDAPRIDVATGVPPRSRPV